jgi:hypothetical protein
MNPLDTSPQPIHQMVPVLLLLSFILLVVVSLTCRLVNWVAKKPLTNGAHVAFGLLLLAMAALTAVSLFHPKVTLYGSRILGQGMAALIPATALSFYLGRRFSRRNNGHPAKLAAAERSANKS